MFRAVRVWKQLAVHAYCWLEVGDCGSLIDHVGDLGCDIYGDVYLDEVVPRDLQDDHNLIPVCLEFFLVCFGLFYVFYFFSCSG